VKWIGESGAVTQQKSRESYRDFAYEKGIGRLRIATCPLFHIFQGLKGRNPSTGIVKFVRSGRPIVLEGTRR